MSWFQRFRPRPLLALPAPSETPLEEVAALNGAVVAVWLERQDQRPVHLADLQVYSLFSPSFYCLRLAKDASGRPRRWTTEPTEATCDDCHQAWSQGNAWARWVLRRRARAARKALPA